MPKRLLAIANYRVSSDEQLLNNSLARQEKSVENAANQLGVEILRSWSGSVSSKKGLNIDRKDLLEMLDTCKKNPNIRYAIFDELDRFMRSMLEIGHFLVEFKRLNVEVVFASQPNLKTDTASNTLMLMLEAFKAEGSNEERQRKSIAGQTTALKEGRYTFVPKPGYMRGRERGIHEIHPMRGPALAIVLKDIASHRITPTQGLINLNNSSFMEDGHFRYKMDKFRKIVTDPFYAGIVEIDKQVKVRNENGLHQPLISIEQHNELIRVMDGKKKNQKGPRKNGNPDFPLSNHISCSQCTDKTNGRYVGFEHSNGRNSALRYYKYRCRSCARYLKREDLHPKIVRIFKEHPVTDKGLKEFTGALDIVWKQREGQAEQEVNRIRHTINNLNDSIKRQALASIEPENLYIRNELKAGIEKSRLDIIKLEDKLSKLKHMADADREQFLKFAFKFIDNMGERFLEISPENRMRCKQLVFPAGFYLDANNKVYTPEISPLYRWTNKKDATRASEMALMVRVQGL